MPWREAVALRAGLAVRRSLMCPQDGHAVTYAVETLQDALEIIVRDILGG